MYKHILFVTDLEDDSLPVIDKVKALANLNKNGESIISVLNIVVDTIVAGGYEIMPLFYQSDNDDEINSHRKKLKNFIEKSKLEADNLEVIEALATASGINQYAEENNADLIVIGLHKREGFFENMLGNTASSVLKDAKCDVLTVMIPHS